MDDGMASRGDLEFGRLTVENKLLREAVVAPFLEKIDEERKRGRLTTLDRLLGQSGHLNNQQIQQIQELQKRRVEFCSHCGRKHNIFGITPGSTVRCDRCRERFEVPEKSPLYVEINSPTKGSSADKSSLSTASQPKTEEAEIPKDDESLYDSGLFELVGAVEPARFACARCGLLLLIEEDICGNCERVESSQTRT